MPYRNKKPPIPVIQFTVRMPNALYKRVTKVAKTEDLSVNKTVEKLLKEAVDAR